MKTDKRRLVRDAVLAAVLLLLGLAFMLLPSEKGKIAEIRIEGQLYGSYSLDIDRCIDIEKDGAFLGQAEIEDGKIYMKSAACDGKDCIKMGGIDKTGQCILCLPCGVGIYIVGEGGPDGVTG